MSKNKSKAARKHDANQCCVSPESRRLESTGLMSRLLYSVSFDKLRLAINRREQLVCAPRGEAASCQAPSVTMYSGGQTQASSQDAVWTVPIWTPAVHLFIDRLEPVPLIEGRKARVYFSISNMLLETLTNLSVTAAIVPQYFPHDVDNVTEYPGLLTWQIQSLAPWDFAEGVITFVVPPASERSVGQPPPNILRLTLSQFVAPTQEEIDRAAAAGIFELFGKTLELASESVRFDSGGRYRLAVTGVSVKSTAAIINDSVLVAVSGSVNGIVPADQHQSLGDHGGSGGGRIVQIPVTLPGVGYFDSVVNGNGDLYTLSYVVANVGNIKDQQNLETALNWISRIAAAVATLSTPAFAPVWVLLEGFTEFLNSLLRGCNRMVAQDLESFRSQDLFNLTFDQDQHVEHKALLPAKEFVTTRGGDEGLACGTSDYFMSRTLFRDRSGIEFIDLGDQDPILKDFRLIRSLGYGQRLVLEEIINLAPGNLLEGLDVAERKWEIEYGEGTINKGTFIAPAGPTPFSARFAVLTLQLLAGGIEKGHGFIVIRFQ
jgi:hypothetical protein